LGAGVEQKVDPKGLSFVASVCLGFAKKQYPGFDFVRVKNHFLY
jgi:hypothetical protein